jgi:hypothetical protein
MRRLVVATAVLALCTWSGAMAARTLAPGPVTAPLAAARQPAAQPVSVVVATGEPLARFSPERALGGALDGHEQGEVAQIYTPANVRAMAAAGLGAVSYRLRTELGAQAWQYAPGGRFSEAARRQGYWTGPSAPSGRTPSVSYGYSLPRRGDTIDQADDSGYSRIDDGDPGSFWKSDPYLDSYFTHEAESAHRQWVLIDLGRTRRVDAIRIAWAAPYARRFSVQRYVGPSAVMLAGHPPGHWQNFPRGRFTGRGGTQTLRLSRAPISVRFVRVLMYASSHTTLPASPTASPTPGAASSTSRVTPHASRPARRTPRAAGAVDARDRLGYAIRELYLGTLGPHGRLRDLLVHRRSKAQTTIYVSSTDPWHRAVDRNPGYEQPSFQTVLRSGLSHGLPLLVPVSLLYGTPAAAVAELRYLRALGVPLAGVELGEEPDGQLAQPEDYGALYLQFARAIHRAFPTLPLGGPGFQTSIPDWLSWPDAHGERSWTRRFLDYLRARGALDQLSFFSFEWYPYDDVCLPPAPQLAANSDLLTRTLALQRAHGLPAGLPIYITEYGYSAFAGQDEVDLPGALLDADTVGTLLADGGTAAFLYGYEPEALLQESERCATWGNLALLQSDEQHRRLRRLATFWETRMLTRDWLLPGGATHTLLAGRSSTVDAAGHQLVRCYAVARPDGRLSLLLLNVSPSQPYDVSIGTVGRLGEASPARSLAGPAQEWQLSAADYRWRAAGPAGRPSLDLPPLHATLSDPAGPVRLPPYSITVVTAQYP